MKKIIIIFNLIIINSFFLMFNYLYLLQDVGDLHTNIYKIGKTAKLPTKRLQGYDKLSLPYGFLSVDDCDKREDELRIIFNRNFKLARGREYFAGNIEDMIYEFTKFCIQKDIINNIIKNNEILKEKELIDLYNKIKNKSEANKNQIQNINEPLKINDEIFLNEIKEINPVEKNNKKIFRCELCNLEFKTKRILEQHKFKINKCNIKTDFQCSFCNKYFKYKKNKLEHESKNHLENSHINDKKNDDKKKDDKNNNRNYAIKIILNNISLSENEKIHCLN